MFTDANPFAQFFKNFTPPTSNASGPFGIPTFNAGSVKPDKEFTWAFDPAFNPMKGFDASSMKSLFPGDFMKSWQDAFQKFGVAAKPAGISSFSDLTAMSKISGIDWQALADAQKKNMEALTAAHQSMLENCQQLSRRQGEMFRDCMQTASTLMHDLMATGTPEEKMGRQVDIAKQAFDVITKHTRELAELCAQGQTQAIDAVSSRVQASLDDLKKSAKTAEEGFEAASRKADDMAKAATAAMKAPPTDTLN